VLDSRARMPWRLAPTHAVLTLANAVSCKGPGFCGCKARGGALVARVPHAPDKNEAEAESRAEKRLIPNNRVTVRLIYQARIFDAR